MKRIVTISFILAIVGSMISQLPSFVVSGTGGFLKVLWIFPFVFMLMDHPKEYLDRTLRPFYYFVMSFFAYCFVLQAFTTKIYIGTDFTNMVVDLAILAVSFKFWKHYGGRSVLIWVSLSLMACAAVLSYVVYFGYFEEQDIFSRQYAYASKNSLSVILFSAILFSVFTYVPKKMMFKIAWWIPALLILYVVVVMRSRSVLGGIAFVYLFFVFRSGNKKIQIVAILLAVFAVFYVYSHPSAAQFFVEGILSAGRDYEDIDDFSSGRVHDIEEGWPLFLNNMFWGNGRYYIDSMPIAMLIQYGIWGALIVFSYLLFVGSRLTKRRNESRLSLASFLLFFVFLINALFEAQAPFGPGVKCFILWMTIGFWIAETTQRRNNETLSNI